MMTVRFNLKVLTVIAVLSIIIWASLELGYNHQPRTWYRVWRPAQDNIEFVVIPQIPFETQLQSKLDATLMHKAKDLVQVALNPSDEQYQRLSCPRDIDQRYAALSANATDRRKFLFAINLHQNADILPRLIGSVLQAIDALGDSNCALSVVEGRSDDGTLEILVEMQTALEERGIQYFLQTTEIDPSDERIKVLAELRNMALQPYTSSPNLYTDDASIIFINDVVLCPEDILELIYQRDIQQADMTCGMDWTYVGEHPTFYDVWIARSMTGDTFFRIPEDGSWDNAWNLFWDNADTQLRYIRGQPLQVFSCWNGIATFTARPVLSELIRFRESHTQECLQGEPKLFCKDMWLHGFRKIAVVPSVNVEYSDEAASKVKKEKGYVAKWLENEDKDYRISWQHEPPEMVKCMPNYDQQKFIPWNEGTKN